MLVALVLFLVELTIGVAYPAYVTLNLITQSGHEDYKTSFKNWTFYWIVFAVLETFSLCLVWLPFQMLKVGLLIFMAVPRLNGSEFLYELLNANALPLVQKGVSLVKEKFN